MNESSSSDPFGAIMFLVWIGIYFYFAFAQYKIAQKAGHDSPWMAYIPIANVWQLVQMASKPWYWMVFLLVPVVNLYCFIVLWMETAKAIRQSPIWGLLMVLPVINFISVGVMAFGSSPVEVPGSDSPKPRTREPEHVG